MTRRYYVPDLPASGGVIEMPKTEAQHAIRVMRVQAGDAVTLFDGKGNEANATVMETGRNDCHCHAEIPTLVSREVERPLHFGVALPKPDRARELIERLTELGVKSVTPLVAERTQRAPNPALLEKLRRGVIESCKQCGRNELMQICATQTADEFLTVRDSKRRLIAHRCSAARPMNTVISEWIDATDEIVVAVGPEGGWTENELALAVENDYVPVDLGNRIYRIETAATVIASLLVT